jgi:hypothetical protein
MARPKKDGPRPDTVLVTFRLSPALVAALDGYAMRQGLPTRSDAARELMSCGLTGSTRMRAPSVTESRILETVRTLARGPGGTLPMATLRARLMDLPRTDLDQTLRRLDSAGEISLGRALDLASLTPDDRRAAINDDVRGMLAYVSLSTGNRSTVSC